MKSKVDLMLLEMTKLPWKVKRPPLTVKLLHSKRLGMALKLEESKRKNKSSRENKMPNGRKPKNPSKLNKLF